MLYNVVLVPDMQQHKSVLTIHIHVYPLPLGGFPVAAAVKNLPASGREAGDASWIPGWGMSARGGNGSPLQRSCLENPRDRGAG